MPNNSSCTEVTHDSPPVGHGLSHRRERDILRRKPTAKVTTGLATVDQRP